MRVVLWAETILYGGAAFLIKGLNKYCDASLCVLNNEPYRYGPENTKVFYFRKDRKKIKTMLKECDAIIVSASISLRYLMEIVGFKNLQSKPIILLIGDSHYCNNCNKFVKPLLGRVDGGFNKLFKENGIKIFLMPDKYQFYDGSPIPYFPPIKISKSNIFPKNKELTVLHLPGSSHKQYEKGTSEILETFERIKAERSDVNFVVPPKIDWKNCMKLKSQSHIYIDQLVKGNDNAGNWRYRNTSGIIYDGGLGKAGIESMYVGALTMASGNDIDTEPYFPKPPVVWVDRNSFEHVLRGCLLDEQGMYYTIKKQVDWARTYTTPKFVAKMILDNMI